MKNNHNHDPNLPESRPIGHVRIPLVLGLLLQNQLLP
jgi:hypothetical protein